MTIDVHVRSAALRGVALRSEDVIFGMAEAIMGRVCPNTWG